MWIALDERNFKIISNFLHGTSRGQRGTLRVNLDEEKCIFDYLSKGMHIIFMF